MINNVKHIAFSEAINYVPQCSYALLYKLSEIKLCLTTELKEDDWVECTEARIFDTEKELHFLMEDEQTVILIEDTSDDLFIEKIYELKGKYQVSGGKTKLVVKQYIEEDEDGQMNIVLTRLVDVR